MNKYFNTINECLKECEIYIKWIEEEEEELKQLEEDWEEMTKEYYESLKYTTDQEEIDRIQKCYLQREMSNEQAQMNRIYSIHRIKACMIKEIVMSD